MEIVEGLELPPRTFTVTRADLVRYAGASGDFNVIHWNERIAKDVGLPNVIAHGMLTMGLAIQLVTDWLDDPSRLLSYGCRFTRPVVVPDDSHGAQVLVSGAVGGVADGTANITLRATCQDVTVLGKATASIKVD
jgi:acyl dehydratase